MGTGEGVGPGMAYVGGVEMACRLAGEPDLSSTAATSGAAAAGVPLPVAAADAGPSCCLLGRCHPLAEAWAGARGVSWGAVTAGSTCKPCSSSSSS